jgi:hypothetical protein
MKKNYMMENFDGSVDHWIFYNQCQRHVKSLNGPDTKDKKRKTFIMKDDEGKTNIE